jgi:hypothetical protein
VKSTWLAVLLVCTWTGMAWAQLSDYQLQICSSPSCTSGIFGGEVNGVTGTTLTIFENGGGSPSVLDPVLLIVGVPNNSTAPPNITAINGSTLGPPLTPSSSGPFWGGTYPTNGTAVSFSSGDAYAALGLGSAIKFALLGTGLFGFAGLVRRRRLI